MKKILKLFFKTVLIIVVLLNTFILISGRTYLYKGIAYTYLRGKKGPDIDDLDLFAMRKIEKATPQAWKRHADYNKKKLSNHSLEALEALATTSFSIIKDTAVLFEKYWEGYTDTTVSNSFSMAKSIISILIGKAIEEGYIKGIYQPVGDFLPEFKEGKKAKITLWHLLTMSSGLNWIESGGNPLSDNAQAYYGDDLRGLVSDLEVIEEPGKEFVYLSGNTQILGFVLEVATGMSLSEYASQRLWQPLGAEHPAFWSLDKEGGMEKAYCCYYATALDFARIGQLFLNRGNWNGQQLLNEDYIYMSISVQGLKESDGTDCLRYGLQWWIANYKNYDLFYARGILGQYIIVVPELNIVVTRAGHKREAVGKDGHPGDLYVILDAAFDILGASAK